MSVEAAKQYVASIVSEAEYAAMTLAQRFQLMRRIPCSIRCWRVGEAVEPEGGVCPECGAPAQTGGEGGGKTGTEERS